MYQSRVGAKPAAANPSSSSSSNSSQDMSPEVHELLHMLEMMARNGDRR